MAWSPIDSAPLDGTDILVRRIEGSGVPPEGATFVAVAQYWVGLWVFMYAATSAPVQLRFVPTEWQPIDQEWPPAMEEPADAAA